MSRLRDDFAQLAQPRIVRSIVVPLAAFDDALRFVDGEQEQPPLPMQLHKPLAALWAKEILLRHVDDAVLTRPHPLHRLLVHLPHTKQRGHVGATRRTKDRDAVRGGGEGSVDLRGLVDH